MEEANSLPSAPMPSPETPINPPTTPLVNSPSSNKPVLIILLIVFLVILSSLVTYLLVKPKPQPRLSTVQSGEPLPTVGGSRVPLFSGQFKRLNQDLRLFKPNSNDTLNGTGSVYYEAGIFNKGELKDYVRVVAVKPSGGPGQPLVFVLATKDHQGYILDDPNSNTVKYPENDWNNPYNFLDKSKILSTKTFETEQPKEINLNQDYSLYAEQFSTEGVPTNNNDKNGNKIYEVRLINEFSSYQKLNSPFGNLTFYFKPRQKNTVYFNQLDQKGKENELLKEKYLLGETEITVVDSTGLPMTYSLATTENVKGYPKKLTQYEEANKIYQEQIKKYDGKQTSTYPQSPDYVYLPNLGFNSSSIDNKNNLKFYSNYQTAVPDACSSALNSRIVAVNDSDLEQIGSISNLSLYRLKDTNHPLYSLAFKNKMDYYDQDPTMFDQVNKGVKKPTPEEYISNNPLLFVKDYWQRWVALGEFDIKLPGGCGKPVIYLYPEKPTKVSVRFQVPIQLTTDIPKYADFWQVMAYSDGSLVNLRPELTDCRQINFLKKGSEYAQTACQKNIYPYLYWAGNINSKDYPTVDRGWIVDRNNLSAFLQAKLSEVGLNDKEKNDFMGYWLPDMIAKNAQYYRISFLQTNDLNLLFPMAVNPNPDTTFRLFLDYFPLVRKPQNLPEPQTLNKLIRNGFTLVEWGGLKRP